MPQDLAQDEAHRIPFVPKTDLTIEYLQIVVEYLAKKHGISAAELWAVAEKVNLEKYQRESAKQMHYKEMIQKNREWILELEDHPLRNALVIMSSGGTTIPIEKFVCSIPECREKLLVGNPGAKIIRDRYLDRGLAVETKEELEQMIRTDMLGGSTGMYVFCPKCGNNTANFRLVPVPK